MILFKPNDITSLSDLGWLCALLPDSCLFGIVLASPGPGCGSELYQMEYSCFPGYLQVDAIDDCIAIRDSNERCYTCVAVVLA